MKTPIISICITIIILFTLAILLSSVIKIVNSPPITSTIVIKELIIEGDSTNITIKNLDISMNTKLLDLIFIAIAD